MSTNSRLRVLAFLPVTVDIVSAIAFVALPMVSTRFETPSGENVLLLSAIFALFAAGVIVLRRLKPLTGTADWLSPRLRVLLALLFALAFMTVAAWQLGFFTSLSEVDTRELGEGPTAVYFVFAPGAWLGVSLLYIIFLGFPLTPSVDGPSTGYTARATFGLAATAAMLLLFTVQGRIMMPADNRLIWGLLAFLVLLALFMPPRVIYVERALGRGRAAAAAIGSMMALCLLCAIWIAGG